MGKTPISAGVLHEPRLRTDELATHDRIRKHGQSLREALSKLVERGDDRISIPKGGEGVPGGPQPSGLFGQAVRIDLLQQLHDGAHLLDALAGFMHRGFVPLLQMLEAPPQLLAYDVFEPLTK